MLVSLRPDPTGAVTAAVCGGVALSLIETSQPHRPWVLGLLIAIALFGWLRSAHHSRLILDTPTSRIGSAAQGYVELFGSGQPLAGEPLRSPMNGLPVLWYRLLIESRDNDNNWSRESEDVSEDSFLIDDGSGVCAIDPTGAEMLVSRKDVETRGDRRFTQWCLIGRDPIYALGEFTTLGSIDPDRSTSRQVSELLAEWKSDHAALLKRFDANGDGEIDLVEWERARAEARREVEQRQREIDAAPEAHLMRQPGDGRLYLISDMDPTQVGRRYQIWGWIFFVAVMAGTAGLVWQLAH
ncbi:MAG: hypothetical protein KDG55_14760 [Rhodocyclaceae bacterium]|nr:hypothetical protein [Rhodocyclaceae bacterium]